ncbi:MAG: DUF305 domain-containing protein [Granulosicoccus sp.]
MSISRRRFLNAGSIALPATLLTSALSASDSALPSQADIGYCQDMSVHHLQALAMCRRVLGRDTGGAVQAAATEVLENQAMEVGQMRSWLTDWGASTVPPEIVMGWMGANQGSGMPVAMMPGYASDEQLLELSLQVGGALGKQWLLLMRAHHVGGVMMASQAKNLASSPKVIRLATLQIVTQNFEISQYDSLLSGSYINF